MNDQEWEELFDRYITEVIDDEQEHIKSHELPTAIKIRSLVSDSATQAAANKAAEEGGPTDAELAQEVLLEDLEAIANYWDGTEVEGASGNTIDVGKDLREKFAKLKFPAIAADRASRPQSYSYEQAHQYAKEAVAYDRASRQVANKAEVEPVAHLKFWARQSWSGNGNHDVEHAEGLEVCEAGEIGDDGEPAFPVYAAPPATTGASTVLTDAQIMQAWASVDTGGNGPELVAFGRAVERLVVAAQAGQVAVPEGWKLVPLEPSLEMVEAGGEFGARTIYKRIIAAAPSPAKESK